MTCKHRTIKDFSVGHGTHKVCMDCGVRIIDEPSTPKTPLAYLREYLIIFVVSGLVLYAVGWLLLTLSGN